MSRAITVLIIWFIVGCVASAAHASSVGAGKTVGILNILDSQFLHLNLGMTRFGDKTTKFEALHMPIPDYVNRELESKLHELGYRTQELLLTEGLRESAPFYLSNSWNKWKISKSGRSALAELMRMQDCDAIIVVHNFVKSDQMGFSGSAVSGYGLYTRGKIRKVFGHIIGFVMRRTDGELLGVSAPLYAVDSDVSELTRETMASVEPVVIGFADHLVSGLITNLDGTYPNNALTPN